MAKPTQLETKVIYYVKPDENVPTRRVIITADKPTTNLQCLDVTELDADTTEVLRKNYEAYQTAFNDYKKAFPSFDAYMTSLQIDAPIKWRSFALNRILPAASPEMEAKADAIVAAVVTSLAGGDDAAKSN